MMKLLFVRSAKKFSGAERYTKNLLNGLKNNLDVTLLTNLKNFEGAKFPVMMGSWLPEEVGTKRQLLKTLALLPFILQKYINVLSHFDIIVFESRTEMIFLTPIMCLLGKKVVWIQHGPLYVSEAAGIVKKLFAWSSLATNKIIAVSLDTKRDLVSGGIQRNKIKVMYIGVTLTKPRPIHRKITIGFFGIASKEKGIYDFMEATKGLSTLIIGEQPEGNKIHTTGFVKNVNAYLQNVDILLFPTHHHEGISMAILESMAMGIPVLATDIGGNGEIIKSGYNGYLVEEHDIPEMKKYISMLIQNRELLRRLGENAQKTIREKFNIVTQGKMFAEFFRSV